MQINQPCQFNQENPTPVKENVAVAINIVGPNPFVNYVLMIDDTRQCCEYWEAETSFTGEGFLEELRPDVELEDCFDPSTHKTVKEFLNRQFGDLQVFHQGHYWLTLFKVDGTWQYAYVYNDHNGYYSHMIYEQTPGQPKISYAFL